LKKIIIGTLIAVFLIIAGFSMKGMLTPYVPFKKAMDAPEYVQVIGSIVKTSKIEQTVDCLEFTLIDKDNTAMKINYSGVKPANFEHAAQVLVIGKYNNQKQIFEADKLLVKCPSKYKKEGN
jgi:cytochrome c-type biogenesis protein CcmE